MKTSCFALAALIAVPAFAQKAGVAVTDIPTNENTSIIIRKGDKEVTLGAPEYTVIEGKDEIFGDPQTDRKAAYNSWKTACSEWKTSMREMNKDLVTLNCNAPALTKEDYQFTFKSMGSYKARVRIRDTQPAK